MKVSHLIVMLLNYDTTLHYVKARLLVQDYNKDKREQTTMWERLIVISVYLALAHGSVAGHIEPGTCVCVTGSNVNARHTGTVFLTITFTMSRYSRLCMVVANEA